MSISQAVVSLSFTGTTSADVNAPSVPDTMGAVGPEQVVELLNGGYAVYDKADGTLISRVSQDAFWNTALAAGGGGTAANTVDARVIYDHSSQRWFATALDRTATPARNILVGVSNSSSPTDGWKAFLVDPDPTDLYFADFPMLGVDADGIYINVDMNDYQPDGITPNPQFAATVISVPKADLLLATPSVSRATIFANLDANNQTNPNSWMHPVIDFGPSDGRAPMISAHRFGFARVDVLNGGTDSASLSPRVLAGSFNYEEPPDAPQPGTNTLIETGSSLLRSAVMQVGGTAWYALSVGVNGRAAVLWVQVNLSNNAILQSGTIADPDLYLYYPSIAVNAAGDVVIGCSGSSSTQSPSAYAIVGETNNGVTTFGGLKLLKAGTGNFLGTFTGPVRWGDYSATVLDPNDPSIFWTFQEFVQSASGWGIQVAKIDVDPPPNTPPSAVDDIAETNEDQAVIVAVLSNDSDAENNSLTVTQVSSGAHGTTAINADGTVTYTPATDYNGSDSFSYQISDGNGGTATATVNVNIAPINDAPTIGSQSFTLAENSPNGTSVGTVAASDIDAGQSLTFAIISGNTGGAFAINAATGQLTVVNSAALDFETTPQFALAVRVTDNGIPALSSTATMTINLTDVAEPIRVLIDVVPGDASNTIRLNSKFNIAILSSATFDARQINVSSIRFGKIGTENSLTRDGRGRLTYSYTDVDGDGRLDLVVKITASLTGLQVGDTLAKLTGLMNDGSSIFSESPVIVKKK